MIHFKDVAERALAARHPSAEFALMAGSCARGDATRHSDIDMVVVYDQLESPFRECFCFEGLLVEMFVHVPESIAYYIGQGDRSRNLGALAEMIVEGIVIPRPTVLSDELKEYAAQQLATPPPRLDSVANENARFRLTDMVDDLRDKRTSGQLIGVLSTLYNELADYYFRANGLWAGTGKAVERMMARTDPDLAKSYTNAFERAFRTGETADVIALADQILAPFGGYFADGYKRTAPDTARATFPGRE